ncbi:MAG TPA: TorF family putative porin [Nevskia sp.]|nr:TorF family putative porin [Nevskia sp.]
MRLPAANASAGTVLALALLVAPGAARAEGWGGSVGLASDYVYRGLTLSANQPAGQLDLHYSGDAGAGGNWYAGLWASSVRRLPDYATSAEFDPYLGYQRRFAQRWSANLSAVRHQYPWDNPGGRYNYEEFSGTVGYADRAFLTVAFSPDSSVEAHYHFVSGRAVLAYDLALRQPLPHAFSLNAGIGYRDLRWAVDSGYVYGNAGVGWDWRRFHLDLSYIGTNGTARRLFYEDTAVRRLVGSVLWRF